MKTTNDFLNAVKASTGAVSDYALAQKLGVTRSSISNYRNNKSNLDDETCLKVARILGIEAGIVLAAIHAERAKNVDEKKAWFALFEKLGGIAAAAVLGIMLNVPNPAQANSKASVSALHNSNQSIHYAKRRKKRSLYNPLESLVNQLVNMA